MDPRSQCTDITLLLPWYVNGTLESGERRMVRSHLIHCPSCRQELARTRTAHEVFAADTALEETNVRSFAAARARFMNSKRTYLAAAAMVAVCLMTAGLWMSPSPAPTHDAEQPQRVTLDAMTFETPDAVALFVTTDEPEAQDADAGRQLLTRESFEFGGFDTTWKAQGMAASTANADTNNVF
jgi:hypothetical protein